MKKIVFIVGLVALAFACNNEIKNEPIDEKKNDTLVNNVPIPTTKDSINQWVSKVLLAYDTIREVDKFLGRAEHLTDTILRWWADSLKGKIGNSTEAKKALFLFIPRFDPIWKNNQYQKEISEKIVSRMRKLSPEQVKEWRRVLRSAHQDGIDDMWVYGLVANADILFSSTDYLDDAGSVTLKRFAIIPRKAISSLSDILNTAKADAAMDIATSAFFFNDTTFRQQTFDEAIVDIKAAIKK